MIVGVLQIELIIHDAMTLKDKRRVVKSIKDRIGHDFNVSIAEVDALDVHRRAILGVSMVGNNSRFVRSALDQLLEKLKSFRGATVVDHCVELL